MPQAKTLRTVEIPACTLPVVAEADVVVVGGGTAVFIAAVAAARTGAHTVLIERWGYLGGALTGTYCTSPGLFGDSEGRQIIKGIVVQSKSGREVIEGKVFVDATSDADIAFLAGAPTEKLEPDQLW